MFTHEMNVNVMSLKGQSIWGGLFFYKHYIPDGMENLDSFFD